MKSPTATSTRPSILFVDDEELAQKYFRKAIGSDFEVLTASSVVEAVRLLRDNSNKIGVVITDQRMPKETGTSLLRQIHKDHPEMIRILTTAYSDLDSAIEAVNEGHIYRYITKPWDIRDLQTVVRQAADLFCLQREYDMLVAEKLSVMQRMILIDRAKALCVLASALQPRLRYSLHAIRDYIAFNARTDLGLDASAFAGWEDLWTGTVDETVSSVKITASVLEALRPKSIQPTDLSGLINTLVADDSSINTEIKPLPAQLGLDVGIAQELIRRLLSLAYSLWPANSDVTLACELAGQGDAVTIRLSGPNSPAALAQLAQLAHQGHWMTAGPHLDLLIVFLAANHHAGHAEVSFDQANLLAIDVHLPLGEAHSDRGEMPDNWVERLFDLLEQ